MAMCFSSLPVPVPNRQTLESTDAAARQSFIEMFWNSILIHVSTIDLVVMSLVVGDPIREDMRRRGWDPVPARIAPFLIPVIGPTLWLVVRPPIVASADVDRGV